MKSCLKRSIFRWNFALINIASCSCCFLVVSIGKYNRVALIFWFCSTEIGLLGGATDSSSSGFSLVWTIWLPIISIRAGCSFQSSAFGSGAIPLDDEAQVRDEFLDYQCDVDQHLFVYATSRNHTWFHIGNRVRDDLIDNFCYDFDVGIG